MKKLSILAGLALALAPLGKAHASAYLKITVGQQGALKNASGAGLKKGAILLQGVDLEAHSANDTNSGLAVGKPKFGTVSIIKGVDDTSDALYKAFEKSETITTFELELWKSSVGGEEHAYLTIKLTNPKFTKLRLVKPWPGSVDAKAGDHEELTFAFTKLEYLPQTTGKK